MKENLQKCGVELTGPDEEQVAGMGRARPSGLSGPKSQAESCGVRVALLTGGSDKPYVIGLTEELLSRGASIDLIGSNELDCAELRGKPGLNFFNLRGDQRNDADLLTKTSRILKYYAKLIGYAATAKPKIFHILWNNKFEVFDRTLLMLYYRILGKRILLTAHNVNAAKRDSRDTFLNRLTLRVQYQLANRVFVHTEKMKLELMEEFGVKESRVTVIPFGINDTVPKSDLSPMEARQRLGIRPGEKAILFFGRIRPSKGLEYLVSAFQQLSNQQNGYRLVVAGRPDNCEHYWTSIEDLIAEDVCSGRIILRSEFIPDEEIEIYFKAADVLVLPYRSIYQSGVLFLAYSFGLPVLASDVGGLKDEIVAGKTGFSFKPEDPVELAKTIEGFFASELSLDLSHRRKAIFEYAKNRYSWKKVGQITIGVYGG
jgi:glycosyltransferase involved in cell wall biosynthesis